MKESLRHITDTNRVIDTTHSTWLDTSILMSGAAVCHRELVHDFVDFAAPAPSGIVRQWEPVYTLLPTLLYARRLIPYRLNPDALLNIGN